MRRYETPKDFVKAYEDFDLVGKNYQNTLEVLLDLFEKEENPVRRKDQMTAIYQLYFDGLCECSSLDYLSSVLKGDGSEISKSWNRQKLVLDELSIVGRDLIGGFYGFKEDNSYRAREVVREYSEDILRLGAKQKAKRKWSDGVDNRIWAFMGHNILLDYSGKIDTVVGVLSGGIEPAWLAASVLNAGAFLPVRFSCVSRKDKDLVIPIMAGKDYFSSVEGKRVLLIDDFALAGNTISKVMGTLRNYFPKSLDYELINGKETLCDLSFLY